MPHRWFSGIGALLLLFASALAQAQDPFAGTWKLNLAKSRYNPPGSAPRSGTIKTDATKTGYRSIGDGIDSEGKRTHWESSPILDGKAHAVAGNPENGMYVAVKVNLHTITGTVTKKGIAISSERSVVSDDGQTLTVTSKQRNSQGMETTNIAVFDRHRSTPTGSPELR